MSRLLSFLYIRRVFFLSSRSTLSRFLSRIWPSSQSAQNLSAICRGKAQISEIYYGIESLLVVGRRGGTPQCSNQVVAAV